ncbi:MAG: MATE family efflux transporter [Clostridiales bacterium]|nr:MATE family efflux transporter [Clostridiales bacterium]MDY3764575.1 MATE family efflux transporter [Candidatus Ventricola sp.]MCI6589209.1 MATE family efflux transporter [Clostridiales bacterium]MDY3832585.1 MATE family efflux transporter [Candidatus Ventricola sp.]MDY4541513.1 MATE family efflux transporter [Candidatus Ventricola sp.]
MLNKQANRTMDMTQGRLLTQVLVFALPIMLSGILQLLFNAADTIVVGRFAGNEALAAVGSVGSLNNMIISLFIGLSVGANVLVARYTGSRNDRAVSDTVHTSVLLSLAGGVLLMIIGVALARPLLELMGSPEDVIDLAVLYVRIIFLGMPVQMLYNFCAAILRAVGDTQRPLYYLTIAGVVNVLLNLVFVILFHLSVAGVALATIISQAISALLVTRALLNMEGPTRLFLNRLRIHPGKLREIIRIGLPAGIQSSVFSLSNVVIQSSVNSFGSVVIAGNAASSNVGNFVYQAMNTFQQAITCFAGQNIGARKPRRIVSAMKVCMFWAVSFGLVLGMLSCVFGTQLLSLFSADPAVIAAGMERQIIVCAPYFLCGMMDVMTGALRGIGYSLLPMIVSILGACAFRLFWVFTVFAAYPTLPCLMLSYPVSWLLTFSVLLVIFLVLWNRSFVPQFTREEMERA